MEGEAKEDRYAWVVLCAGCGLRMLYAVPVSIMGVLLLDFTHRFHEASEVLINTVLNTQYSIAPLFGKLFLLFNGGFTSFCTDSFRHLKCSASLLLALHNLLGNNAAIQTW